MSTEREPQRMPSRLTWDEPTRSWTPHYDNPGELGPQDTPAAAYRQAAAMASAIASRARRRSTYSTQPVYVRVDEVEHLAAGLAARAEEVR